MYTTMAFICIGSLCAIGADIRSLCTEAAMGPVRDLQKGLRGGITGISAADVPAILIGK